MALFCSEPEAPQPAFILAALAVEEHRLAAVHLPEEEGVGRPRPGVVGHRVDGGGLPGILWQTVDQLFVPFAVPSASGIGSKSLFRISLHAALQGEKIPANSARLEILNRLLEDLRVRRLDGDFSSRRREIFEILYHPVKFSAKECPITTYLHIEPKQCSQAHLLL